MKLIYIWINNSKNGFIKGQGFNISGRDEFEFDEEKKLLTSRKKDEYIENFWENPNILGLTAIVGENGAGKSTLLSEIMEYSIIVPHELHGDANSRAEVYQRKTEKKIVVYEEGGFLYYDHNLGYEIQTMPVLPQMRIDAIKECSKIYVSNSMNNSVYASIYQGENVLDYSLTDSTITEQARVIINKNRIPDYIYPSEQNDDSRYYDDPETHRVEEKFIKRARELNNAVKIDANAYKNLNSLIRLYFLVKSKCKEYAGKKYGYVTLKHKTEKDIFGQKKFEELLDTKEDLWYSIAKLKRKSSFSVFNELTLFFIYEYSYYYQQESIDEIEEISIEQVIKIRDFIKEHLHRKIEDSLQENMTTDEYFINAANDLILFNDLMDKNHIINSGWDKADMAYYEALQVNLKGNDKFFQRLFTFLDNGLPSIFLRYLTFEFEGLSSGEEALLNLYSRIFWIFNSQKCKKESLILIDEIDLYMHPKWQRELITYIVRDIPNLVGKDNEMQIVISTHSPIILSDLPRQNVIFLSSKDGHCHVDDLNNHKKTFGNNIHTLFLDSFFLNNLGTMGLFSENKINRILSKLKGHKQLLDENQSIFKTINCIGDELIRRRLLEIYEKKIVTYSEKSQVKNEHDLNAVENTINLLRKQVCELNATIRDLERIKND
ncbi:AAA family ATPase [Anaerotignum propionicum]|uniref:AAA family ATPase n=1 Tax=Anaerotignum propionicum TaxID=28446 RepID=UPI0028968B0C|nr:AAA family ATPase [Anaerotignum propionicum]